MTLKKAARLILVGAPGVGKGTQTERMLNRYTQLSSISSGDLLRENVRNKTPLGVQAESIMKRGELVPDSMILRLIRNTLTTKGWLYPKDGHAPAYNLNSMTTGYGSDGTSESRGLAHEPHDDSFITIPSERESEYTYSTHPSASFILDGFPRTAGQADQLDSLIPINMVIHIHTPTEIILDRICNRWIHPRSGRVYNTTYNAPKENGKDDLTGEPLIQRDDDKPEVWKARLKGFEDNSRSLLEHYDKLGVLWKVQGNSSDEITPKIFEEFGKSSTADSLNPAQSGLTSTAGSPAPSTAPLCPIEAEELCLIASGTCSSVNRNDYAYSCGFAWAGTILDTDYLDTVNFPDLEDLDNLDRRSEVSVKKRATVSTFYECQLLCDQTVLCLAFNFFETDCQLFTEVIGQVVAQPGSVAAQPLLRNDPPLSFPVSGVVPTTPATVATSGPVVSSPSVPLDPVVTTSVDTVTEVSSEDPATVAPSATSTLSLSSGATITIESTTFTSTYGVSTVVSIICLLATASTTAVTTTTIPIRISQVVTIAIPSPPAIVEPVTSGGQAFYETSILPAEAITLPGEIITITIGSETVISTAPGATITSPSCSGGGVVTVTSIVTRIEIRLLQVLAGRWDQPIRARFVYVDMAASASYETISYFWGDATSRETIFLVDTPVGTREDFMPTDVPASSYAALRCMRDERHDRMLWIDAICILQEDNVEKSSQIKLMGLIYRRSRRNLIFLGEHDASLVAVAVRELTHRITNTAALGNSGDFSDALFQGGFRRASPGLTTQYQDALLNVLALPWFQRLWVLQEVALASENECFCSLTGLQPDTNHSHHRWSFSLRSVLEAALWASRHNKFIERALGRHDKILESNLLCIMTLYHHSRLTNSPEDNRIRQKSFAFLLREAIPFKCSHEHDRIYSLLAMSPYAKARIEPDYSLPVNKVYAQVTRVAVDQERALMLERVLWRPRFRESLLASGQLPSWVPDFREAWDSSSDTDVLALWCKANDRKPYQPSGTDEDDDEELELKTTGVSIDELIDFAHASPLPHPQEDTASWLTETLHCLEELQKHPPTLERYSDNAGLDSAFKSTIFGGSRSGNVRCNAAQTSSAFDRIISSQNLRGTQPGEQSSSEQATQLLAADVENAATACRNRQFFLTSTGFFGLGPRGTQPGDIAVVLNGFKWPGILRPVPSQHGRYWWCGICYIHGIMDGSWIRKRREQGVPEETFILV
ncbi:hypothetical protein MBLNU230_g3808t1 [Neophaeotheca triangularis]